MQLDQSFPMIVGAPNLRLLPSIGIKDSNKPRTGGAVLALTVAPIPSARKLSELDRPGSAARRYPAARAHAFPNE